jgi:hypothetical protein
LSFSTFGLVEYHVKNAFRRNEHTLIQNEKFEMFLNEAECEDKVMEEI